MLCERDLLLTLVFSSLFSIKIFSLLPVDVGTLLNHVKSGVLWLCDDYSFNCLLVVDFLRYSFRYGVFHVMILRCMINARSSTPLIALYYYRDNEVQNNVLAKGAALTCLESSSKDDIQNIVELLE